MKTRRITLFTALSWAWFIVNAIILFCFLEKNLDLYLNSDYSGELILAKDIAQKGLWILDKNWFYSTEIRILNSQAVFAFLFRIINNWHIVRLIGTIFLIGIMQLSLAFLLYSMGLGNIYAIIGGMLFLPFTQDWLYLVLTGVFYIPYISISFITCALIIQMCYKEHCKLVKALLMFALGLLSLTTGMLGMRQFLVLYIPLVVSTSLACVLKNKSIIQEFSLRTSYLKSIWNKNTECFAFALSLYTLVIALVGFVIDKTILEKNYAVTYSLDTTAWIRIMPDRLAEIVNSWIQSYGFVEGSGLISLGAICNITAIGVCCIIVLYFVKSFSDEKDILKIQIGLYFLVAVLLFSITTIFANTPVAPRYNLSIAVFGIIIIVFFFMKTKLSKTIVILSAFVGAILIYLMSYVSVFANYDYFKKLNHERTNVVNVLVTNDYYNGYASFWNGNVLTELSNGKIEVWVCGCDSPMPERTSELFCWLQKVEHVDRKPEGKVFFVTNTNEINDGGLYSKLDSRKIIYQSDTYIVYGYNSYEDIPDGIK